MGYGVVNLDAIALAGEAISDQEIDDSLTLIERAAREHPAPGPVSEKLPDIRDFFFAHLWLPPGIREGTLELLGEPRYAAARKQGFVPSAPRVRYEMRGWFRKDSPTFLREPLGGAERLNDLRHDLMGVLKRGSKLFSSHLYQTEEGWEFRVWGWVPDLSTYSVQRDDLLGAIRQRMGSQEFAKALFGLDLPLQVEWHSFDRQGTQSLADYLRSLVSQTERRAR
jgi:hypothetical protein